MTEILMNIGLMVLFAVTLFFIIVLFAYGIICLISRLDHHKNNDENISKKVTGKAKKTKKNTDMEADNNTES